MADNVDLIRQMADKIEEFSYMKAFSPAEMEKLRIELANKSIKVRDLKVELRESTKALKDEIKFASKEIEADIVNLKQKARVITEKCFVEYDRENYVAKYYSPETGEMIHTRPMYQDEMQLAIKVEMKIAASE